MQQAMGTSTFNEIDMLICELGISKESFCASTGLLLTSINSTEKASESSHIDSIHSIFEMLKTWFESPPEAWQWYTEQPISAFGNITAAEIVTQHPETGASTVLEYIESKELGCFE